jgi:glutamate synthase (NADPH/NADH) small chain
MEEIPHSEFSLPVDMVILAVGFVHPEHDGMVDELDLDLDDRGNIDDDNYQTNRDNFFAAGDMRRGASLIVWAIKEGQEVADRVYTYLTD